MPGKHKSSYKMKSSGYKMKYQGKPSAFPFKESPMKNDDPTSKLAERAREFLPEKVKEKTGVEKASEKVQEEDTLICERVQKGLESGLFFGGPYVPKFEGSMYDFHQQLMKSYLEF